MRILLTLLACAASTVFLVGCDDNPACVFGGDCSGGGVGGLLGNSATFPETGQFVDPALPSIISILPSGSDADPETPIMLVFSETMVAGFPEQAFEILPVNGFGPIALAPAALLGSGRVLILRPSTPLQLGFSYEIRLRTDADELLDLNGQVLREAPGSVVGSFSVASSAPTAPSVVTSYPADGALFQSETTEMIVMFSRPVNESTVIDPSFVVEVDGDPPAFDPLPQALEATDLLQTTDSRVWIYRSVDGQGEPVPLGTGAEVTLTLSPATGRIQDLDDIDLPTTTIRFDLAPISVVSANVLSTPMDAINIAVMTNPAGMNQLLIRATIDGEPLDNDDLDVFLFGSDPTEPDPMNPQPRLIISLSREVPVGSSVAPVDIDLVPGNLDLLSSSSPLTGRFSDGPLAIALRLRRGLNSGPVFLLDIDPLTPGIQDVIFDVRAPVVLRLGAFGTGLTALRSDTRDVVISGFASEPLRAAFVSTAVGDNGPDPMIPPEVVGSDPSGLFVAAPVRIPGSGVLSAANEPLATTLTVYDSGLNSAVVPLMADFTQIGASGPALGTPGQFTVEVFDATTLAPIANALVQAHTDDGSSDTLVDEEMTDTGGSALLDAVGGEVLLTVDASGYDMVTFHGPLSDAISLPLTPTALVDAQVSGTVATPDNALSSVRRQISDSRLTSLDKLFDAQSCVSDPLSDFFNCPFGPASVRPRLFGAQSLVAASTPLNQAQYSPFTFLIGFELIVPTLPLEPGVSGLTRLELPFLLNDIGVDPEELAIDAPIQTLDTVNYPGLVGDPLVRVEAISPGVQGAAAVGLGVAFFSTGSLWTLRSAYAGAADGIDDGGGDQLGRLVQDGTIEADLYLVSEVVDSSGSRGMARTRLSNATGSLVPPAGSTLQSPTPGTSSGGFAYDLLFADVLPDVGGLRLYRVTLTGTNGRRWTLYRADPAGVGGTVRIRVPDQGVMGVGLPAGSVGLTIEALAASGLDPSQFLWTELERELELFSRSRGFSFSQP